MEECFSISAKCSNSKGENEIPLLNFLMSLELFIKNQKEFYKLLPKTQAKTHQNVITNSKHGGKDVRLHIFQG
jgi:hypothetical protein